MATLARGRGRPDAHLARRRAATPLQVRKIAVSAGLRAPPVSASSRLDLSWHVHVHVAAWRAATMTSRALRLAVPGRHLDIRVERTGEPALSGHRPASTWARSGSTALASAAGVPRTTHASQVATPWTQHRLVLASRALANVMPSLAARVASSGPRNGLDAVATRTRDAPRDAAPGTAPDAMPGRRTTRRIVTATLASASAVRRLPTEGPRAMQLEHAAQSSWSARAVEQVWHHAAALPDAAAPTPTWREALAAAPEPAPTRSAAPATGAASLDPAVAERLADDVVRRVERQLRIERERRGL
jgi:hypothetical protein